MSEERTEISELGEFGLIDHLTRNLETYQAGTLLSVGDDAAVIDQFGRQSIITTDMLLEGIHFDLMYTKLRHLGYKAVAVNLSDVYAMFATPTHITISIGISNRFSVEALDDFYAGVYEACEKFGVDLIGGDTCSSLKGFVISVTAIGEVAPDEFVSRSGAENGDLICVSGDLGAAYLGLQLLEREKKIFLETNGAQPDFNNKEYILKRFFEPEPRADIISFLKEAGIQPTAMIDVSDGLSSDLMHLCHKSEKGCIIYEDKLPIHPEAKEMAYEFHMDPTTCALNGGEDYELLFTIKQSDYEKLSGNSLISVIGHMTEAGKTVLRTKSGNDHPLKAQGWNAFN